MSADGRGRYPGVDDALDEDADPCYFWDGERCHYEMLVIGIGGPCADCPEESEAIASLDDSR